MNNHQEVYREEAYELLEELETSLLELEETPEDIDLISKVFRAMHTIKGSGAMFGFDNIATFTHEVETVFDLVRNGKLKVTKELISLTLAARDVIRIMLESSNDNNLSIESKSQEIVSALKKLIPQADHKNEDSKKDKDKKNNNKDNFRENHEYKTYKIHFEPDENIFKTGTNPIFLLDELREFGKCKIEAFLDLIPDLENYNDELCYTHWNILLRTSCDENEIKDVFIFVEDDCKLEIAEVDEKVMETDPPIIKSDLITEEIDLTKNTVETGKEIDLSAKTKNSGNQEIDATIATDEENEIENDVEKSDNSNGIITSNEKNLEQGQEIDVERTPSDEAKHEKKLAENKEQKTNSLKLQTSVRVPSEKLDSLVDLVGELVTVQARLSQFSNSLNDSEMILIAEQVERLISELRNNTMSLRMLPIGTMFSKFKRLVRDLSNELGRKVEMETEGAETELDKTVIEKLSDPLVHLIRNSIDHGIEAPDVRKRFGKSEIGTVKLSAIHSGASVLIRIEDDGKGLDVEKIRRKAIDKELISEDTELSEKEIFALIFAPGFSTAEVVSNVSGRGVGMDVVKKTIDSLDGTVEVNSEKGIGTTITLKLPLTLAIIEGLLVVIEDSFFVFPLNMVEECIEHKREKSSSSNSQKLINVRGNIVPYVNLRDYFNIQGTPPDIQQVVIAEVDNQMMGFVVDKVIGEHQTVIKNLSKIYKDVQGLSGATILGDGTVALILDIPKLERLVEKQELAVCEN